MTASLLAAAWPAFARQQDLPEGDAEASGFWWSAGLFALVLFAGIGLGVFLAGRNLRFHQAQAAQHAAREKSKRADVTPPKRDDSGQP